MHTEAGKTIRLQLAQRLEEDRKDIEEMLCDEMKYLAEELKKNTDGILDSVVADVGSCHKELSKYMAHFISEYECALKKVRSYMKLAIIGCIVLWVCLCLSLSAGAWGLTKYWAGRIWDDMTHMQQLDAQIAARQQALDNLTQRAWGLELRTDNQGRWILLPAGIEVEGRWEGQRVALRLVQKLK